MNGNVFKSQKVLLILSLLIFTNTGVNSQTNNKKEIYQNQQRALALSFLNNDIKNAEDAPMRCFLRFQIVSFIFERKVIKYFDTANLFTVDCLDDIEKNPEQFNESQKSYWKSRFISLLRINSPETAKKIEKKYLPSNFESDWMDFLELDVSKDQNAIVNRILAKLSKGEMPTEVSSFIERLREKNPQAVAKILDALLNFYEIPANLDESGGDLNFLVYDFLNEKTSPEIRKRFLYFAVNLGQRTLIEPENRSLFYLSRDILKQALPAINLETPTLFQQASTIYATLNSKSSKEDREKEAVYKRIDDSEDKLAQTIAEAEATENKALKGDLWMSAGRLALEQKKFQVAVDSILKIESDDEVFKTWRTQFLIDDVLDSASKENDFEAANYAIKQVADLNERGRGILKMSARFVELKDKPQAFEKLDEALKVIEKSEDSSTKVRILFSAVPIAVKIDKAKAFDIASSAIKVVNHLPTPDIDSKIGTDSRKKYVSEVLMTTSFNIVSAFKILSKEDVSFAFPITQEIQQKQWKLAAQIIAETEKNYAYTPETVIKSKGKD
jgi:hypothetical protein